METSDPHPPSIEDLLLQFQEHEFYWGDVGGLCEDREKKNRVDRVGVVVDSYIPLRQYHSRGRVLLGVAGRCLHLPVFVQNRAALFPGQYHYPLFCHLSADK